MYKWVVGKDSTIEFVGDPQKNGGQDSKTGEKKGNEKAEKPSRASRRKGRLPPQKTVKVEPPYPDEFDEDMSTSEDECDNKNETETKDSGPAENVEKEDQSTSQGTPVVKEEPVSEEEEAYGVMPTSVATSTSSQSYGGTTSDVKSTDGSQNNDTDDQSDSACDLSTGHREQPAETNATPSIPHTLPVANGIMPINTLIQTGTPIFVAAVPSITATVQPVQAVDGSNPLNLIASTAALAPKVAVDNTGRNSSQLNGTDRLIAASKAVVSANRKRADKQPVPDHQKDNKYFERRRRNNLAAKRSRDARRAREEEMSDKIAQLEQENAILRAQLNVMKERAETLRKNLEEGTSTSSS